MAKSKAPDYAAMTVEELAAESARLETEERFRRALRNVAFDYGYVHQYHTRFSVGSDPGFPDEVFLNDAGRCIVVECKRVGKQPTEKQYAWLEAFGRVTGVESYWWTPAQWREIHDVLGRGLTLTAGEEG